MAPKAAHLRATVWSRGVSADDRSGRNCARWPVPLVIQPEQNVIGSSIRRKPLIFNASTQTKAFVTPGRDVVAFLLLCGDAADVRHENTGFPRDVGADVP